MKHLSTVSLVMGILLALVVLTSMYLALWGIYITPSAEMNFGFCFLTGVLAFLALMGGIIPKLD